MKVTTNEELIEIAEKIYTETKYIEVTIDEKTVKIPLIINMNSLTAYEKEINENEDKRKAFCKLLTELSKFYKNQSEDLDFNQLNDEKLYNIMQNILQEDDYLGKYFKNNNYEYNYENFYKAYNHKATELSETFQEILSPLSKSITKSIELHNKSLKNMLSIPNMIENKFNKSLINASKINMEFTKAESKSEYYDSIMKNFKNPEHVTNELLQSVKEEMEQQTKILSEEQEARKLSDEEFIKKDKTNFRLAIIGIIIGVLSLLVPIIQEAIS